MENDAALESPFLQLSSDGWGQAKAFKKIVCGGGIDLVKRLFLKTQSKKL